MREAHVWFPGKRVSERRMSTCSPLAFDPPVRQVGGGIVAAKAYKGCEGCDVVGCDHAPQAGVAGHQEGLEVEQ